MWGLFPLAEYNILFIEILFIEPLPTTITIIFALDAKYSTKNRHEYCIATWQGNT